MSRDVVTTALAAFTLSLALVALVLFGAMLAGPGPSTGSYLPQPIPERTATP